MQYIRDHYRVPAKRGARVRFDGRPGVITGSAGQYLYIRLDGEKRSEMYHPTWQIDYVEVDHA